MRAAWVAFCLVIIAACVGLLESEPDGKALKRALMDIEDDIAAARRSHGLKRVDHVQ